MSENCFGMVFRFCFKGFGLLTLLLALVACKGGKADGEDVAGTETVVEQAGGDDEYDEGEDTLVYVIPETPLTEAVDESFPDFLYSFLNRKSFQRQRAAYPVEIRDESGMVVETLRNGRSVSEAVRLPEQDWFVMLMAQEADPYDYLDQDVESAEMQVVSLASGRIRSYAFNRLPDGWKLTGISERTAREERAFLDFYHRFATDSIYRSSHLAEEIYISIPSPEDDMETINGNIDPDQWDVFTPELPEGDILVLDIGTALDDHRGVKLVKCGVATSMMEILTFEKNMDEWKLVRYEE